MFFRDPSEEKITQKVCFISVIWGVDQLQKTKVTRDPLQRGGRSELFDIQKQDVLFGPIPSSSTGFFFWMSICCQQVTEIYPRCVEIKITWKCSKARHGGKSAEGVPQICWHSPTSLKLGCCLRKPSGKPTFLLVLPMNLLSKCRRWVCVMIHDYLRRHPRNNDSHSFDLSRESSTYLTQWWYSVIEQPGWFVQHRLTWFLWFVPTLRFSEKIFSAKSCLVPARVIYPSSNPVMVKDVFPYESYGSYGKSATYVFPSK